MNSYYFSHYRQALVPFAVIWLAGCTLAPSPEEKQARSRLSQIGETLHPARPRSVMPELRADSPLAEYVRFAVLNHPQVEAAYQDWRASVSAIAPTRALPDPQLTFQADITDTLMTLMPGIMFEYMTPGKRSAMGREATASSNIAYRTYIAAVLSVAADARNAWIELAYIDEAVRLRESSVGTLEQSLEIADTDYVTGRGMGTLANQVRVTNDIAKVRVDLANLADRRNAVHHRLKSALGLAPAGPDPVWPRGLLAATVLPGEDELWAHALAANPELGRMRAMVEMAIASIEVAKKARTPDFSVGAMADLKANPLMVRPTASVTLPIWREKIAASISAAEARSDASAARVTAEQLTLAAQLAQMLYMVREADRMIAYIDETALPNFDRAIATIGAGYQSGITSPSMIPETQLMALSMRLERATTLRSREEAVTDVMLLTADVAPAGAPLLSDTTTNR
jgi:cobalt-zinc-cadmium efflux system outer membrane protein